MRYLFVLVLLMSCQTTAPLEVCEPVRCLPDSHFDATDCRCVLNDNAHLDKGCDAQADQVERKEPVEGSPRDGSP
jgi:hypothetical protein